MLCRLHLKHNQRVNPIRSPLNHHCWPSLNGITLPQDQLISPIHLFLKQEISLLFPMFTTQLTQLWASTLPNDHGLENDETTMWSPSAIHCYGVPRTSLPHSGHLPIGPKGMPGTFQAHFDQLPRATQGYPGLPIATCLLLTSPHDYSDTLTLPEFFHKH